MSRNKKTDSENSKFWLDDDFEFDGKKPTQLDLIRLSACRRAISNFVMILTGEKIPVKFAEKTTSSTDGKSINIGGELSRGHIDSTVGLALHEGSHIVKSDFAMLVNFWGKIPNSVYLAGQKKMSKTDINTFTKKMLNYVEDRYIDAWAFKTAPGYRGYYVALYNRYFNDPEVTKGLLSKGFARKPTLRNYKFRIINITNPESPLDALPRLEEIYEKLDLDNILRLSTPKDRLELACEIATIVLEAIVEEDNSPKKKEDKKPQKGDSDGSDSGEKSSDEISPTDDIDKNDADDVDDVIGGENGESEHVDTISKQDELKGEAEEDESSDDLTKEQINRVKKKIQEQDDLIDGNPQHKSFSDEVIKKLESLDNSDIELIPVGGDFGVPIVDCILVKNFTKQLIEDENFPYSSHTTLLKNQHEKSVLDGVRLGRMLGRKLQIRNDSHVTRFTRQNGGRIEKRLIADLGFGSEQIFYKTAEDKYKNTHMHISVDASTSMSSAWGKTLTSVVAMAKAASMVKNLDVTISFRSSVGEFGKSENPYILIAYDSRKDKFSKIIQLFPSLNCSGTTPEGLAFEAILDYLPRATPELDCFFVNLSDGEPYFGGGSYRGEEAWSHTKKQVDYLRKNGVQIISYYLENDGLGDKRRSTVNTLAFKKMYGKDALIIDINNVMEIAHTMNKKFLNR